MTVNDCVLKQFSFASYTQPSPAQIAFTIRAGVGWVWLARQKQLFSCELEVPSGIMLNPMGLYDLEGLGYLLGCLKNTTCAYTQWEFMKTYFPSVSQPLSRQKY